MSDAARLMDRIYGPQRHIYDATRKFYLLGRDRLVRALDPPDNAHILEVGCGTARNLIRIARTYPRVACYGIDISEKMLETASRNVARSCLRERIHLAPADASRFDPHALFGRASFDRVVISYALSMIPPWRGVLAQAAGVLAPEGSLHVVDFGDQARLPAAFGTLLRGWLAQFHVEPRDDLGDEMLTLACSRHLEASVEPLYRGYALAAELKRMPDAASVEPIGHSDGTPVAP